jgi:hypothetical protein
MPSLIVCQDIFILVAGVNKQQVDWLAPALGCIERGCHDCAHAIGKTTVRNLTLEDLVGFPRVIVIKRFGAPGPQIDTEYSCLGISCAQDAAADAADALPAMRANFYNIAAWGQVCTEIAKVLDLDIRNTSG